MHHAQCPNPEEHVVCHVLLLSIFLFFVYLNQIVGRASRAECSSTVRTSGRSMNGVDISIPL